MDILQAVIIFSCVNSMLQEVSTVVPCSAGPIQCDFESDLCGFTLDGHWTRSNHTYNYQGYRVPVPPHGDTYIVTDWRHRGSSGPDLVTSPCLLPGKYSLVYEFYFTGPNISISTNTTGGDHRLFSPSPNSYGHTWGQLATTISEQGQFKITLTALRPSRAEFLDFSLYQAVGIDNIHIERIPPLTTKATLGTTESLLTREQTTPFVTADGATTESYVVHHDHSTTPNLTKAPTLGTYLPTSAVPKKTFLERALKASCTGAMWNISIDLEELKHDYPNAKQHNIYFGETSCLGVLKGQYLIFTKDLHECSTSQKISGGNIIYENNVYYVLTDPEQPFIIRQHGWTYNVECDVTRNVVNSTHIHHDIESHHVSVTSKFDVNLAFYRDPNFMDKMAGNPLHVTVGDTVYVKVYSTVPDWTVKMRLHTCYTKPYDKADDSQVYFIIKNGCEVDRNTHVMSQSTHETRFMFQDFEYTTYHEGLDVYCNATFCNADDFSRDCAQMCLSP